VCSGQHNPWLFLVAVVFAAGTQATVPGNAQGQEPTTSFAGARVRLALRDRPDRWLIGTVVGQHGDSLRLDERDSHAMLAVPPERLAALQVSGGRSWRDRRWAVQSETWEPRSPLRTSSRMVPTGAARRPALGLSLQF